MRYFKKLVGKDIYLSPMNSEDFEIYTKWLNCADVTKNLGNYSMVISLDSERKSLEQMTTSGYNFAIVLAESDTLIGNISLMDVNNLKRKATLGLFIGDEDNRNKGYGSQAIELLLDYGFNSINLHNIMLKVFATNTRAIACYKKVGFTECGRRREDNFIDGEYIDTISMDILEDEFRSRNSP